LPDSAEFETPHQVILAGRRSMLVRLTSEDGKRAALLDMLNTYTDGLAEEPGTEMFMVSLDPEDPNIVWLFEIFTDEDAENAHRASSGFAMLMELMPPLLDGPPAVLRMEPLRLSMQDAVLTEDWAF
jgi:(4S)-4-hydroxy-5-phosphonooxypentane-2,3-dione isomerase